MPKWVEEKFEKYFGYLARCEERFWCIDPKISKFWVEMGWKCRNRLCQNLKFRFFQNLVSGKWKICTSNSISILNFGDRNSKSIPKIEKSAPQNLKFDFDFEFWGLKFDFEILKIVFFNSSRISFRDHQIWNQRPRKPPNLHFRFKILIFLRPKSWFCIRFVRI